MDEKRAKTLEALDSFIRAQRALLAHTQEDIAKLRTLKSRVLSEPVNNTEGFLLQMEEVGEVNDPSFYQLRIPANIDWDAFDGCDPAPLHALTLSTQEKHAARSKPSPNQTSPLSELQTIVKESRKTIIDPVLEQCTAYTEQLSIEDVVEHGYENEGENGGTNGNWKTEFERAREREREKIRELKKRKVHGGLSLPGLRGLGTGTTAVFVRRDMEDESADVDVTAGDDVVGSGGGDTAGVEQEETEEGAEPEIDVDLEPPWSIHEAATTSRPRRATAKAQSVVLQQERDKNSKRRQRQSQAKVHASGLGSPGVQTTTPATPVSEEDVDMAAADGHAKDMLNNGTKRSRGDNNKPKSETYKQAWSVSEQHLLEQLLEQIPAGEKNRWQKISRAMDGRRTPRQVASRVQKYFEKLKRFGIDIDAGVGVGGPTRGINGAS
ncbi:hypothetical protein AX17_002195 [Amanita inopinata Kibby_2008]|nr:hypothetical protein AX17_002195 [Amanita inopinata Kibby_2008]